MTVLPNELAGSLRIVKPNDKPGVAGDVLNLGNSLDFGFGMYTDAYPSTAVAYTILTNSDRSNYNWLLGSGSTTEFRVNGTGIALVSAVPIPSAALLLGSGVIGLLGIGSRRKKATA